MVEILAPVGSIDNLYAAVSGGADAVYLGGDKFNARATAANFSIEGIKDALLYCRERGVKLYVTFNILIKESEIAEAIGYANDLYKIGVDAVIVQDLGLLKELRAQLPRLEVHASTQMGVSNVEGVLLLKGLGVRRVVLAREMPLSEIALASSIGVETEVFVHGALCFSYSGQCLMSSLIGGRSGNRGRCAQPCRKIYSIGGIDKYHLSPKDLCTVEGIGDIIKSGVRSLKIEGRLKSPEYVYAVTKLYRKAVDHYYGKGSLYSEEEYLDALMLFNRGTTKGFILGDSKSMMSKDRPNNQGIVVGEVSKGRIIASQDIFKGDSLEIRGNNSFGFCVEEDVPLGSSFVINEMVRFRSGDLLYRTNSRSIKARISRDIETSNRKGIFLDIDLSLKALDKPKALVKWEGGELEIALDFEVERARNAAITDEEIIVSLSKLGGTGIAIKEIRIEKDEVFVSKARLNEIRRTIVDRVRQELVPNIERAKVYSPRYVGNSQGYLSLHSESKRVIEYAIQNGIEIITSTIDQDGIFKQMPNLSFSNELDLRGDSVQVSNLGHIVKYRGNRLYGDYSLNAFNSSTIDCLRELGLERVTLSPELSFEEIKDISKSATIPIDIIVYGRICLMTTRHDFEKASSKGFDIIDSTQEKYRVIKDSLGNSKLYRRRIFLSQADLDRLPKNIGRRIVFIDESEEEQLEILDYYIKGKQISSLNVDRGRYTKGIE